MDSMDSIPLHHKTSAEDLGEANSDARLCDVNRPSPSRFHNRTARWLWLLHTLSFLLSFSMMFSALQRRQAFPTDQKCAEQLSAYSPYIGLVEYEQVRFQGSLFDTNPYKGPPTPDLDAAWKRITHMAQLKVSAEDMLRLNKPLTQVKVAETEGDGYAAGIEVFHQLHCVNLVRQYTYYDYYANLDNKPAEFHDSKETLRLHVDHCIDLLRQVIQCGGDVGVVTRSWVKGRRISYPDFNVWHKCRKLDPILRYSEANDIDTEPVRRSDSLELLEPPCTNAAPDEACP
ncbi:oxidase ustYa family protein [Aspergillus saccharolyticus JOP 1030-1]|uniref:Tat pathway signal sequence n=1 Tax=Aspergillus saccharolyticus JOP 1030-1 TaxID=1450539 RepID=A0A318Z091_9EURO|nr:hypothetical protein BP01DRAFT_350721 [Aspergillus saccharolyticus JOP 1030-1]PYH40701.1 hypothetical protein BP01DRAFT_350721 [Aspergillus saccharolyticus JOP 1030-1]